MNTNKDIHESGENWIPVSEAAAASGVSTRTVRRWLAGGELTGQSVALDGGGRAWLVLADAQFIERTQTERTRLATRTDKRTDAARKVAKRPNLRLIERKDTRTDTRLAKGMDSERPNEGAWPNAAPEVEKAERREADFREEIRFLRSTIEQLQRDGAETRAALRKALEAMPKLLTAATPETARIAPEPPQTLASSNDSGEASNGPQIAPEREETGEMDFGEINDLIFQISK